MKVPMNVRDFLDRGASVFPDRELVADEPGTTGSLGRLTFADVASQAAGLAAALEARGLTTGDRVAIVSPNCARYLIAFFGVSGYGRVLVPVNFRLTPTEVHFILEHSGASLVLVDPDHVDLVEGNPHAPVVVLDGVDDADLFGDVGGGGAGAAPAGVDGKALAAESGASGIAGGGAVPTPWAPDEDATASVNYTSGTTARPKGVQLTHRNLWLNATTFGWHTGVSDRDVYLHTLPMFHCNGWGMPYALTGMGARQVVLRKVDGEEILRRVDAEGVTLLCGAPAVVAAVLDAAVARRATGSEVPGAGTVRIVVAGAPPPSSVIERVEVELGWEFIQIYGLTETAPLLTINRAAAEYDGLPPAERARLLSRAGAPAIGVQVQTDTEGEVLARANHVFEGYWEQPDETAKAQVDGWFHTGDGGYIDGSFLVISDRKKDVIISGGENVSSIEVEDVLYQHPDVAEAAVIGVPDDKWGETVKALVLLREGSAASEADLIEHCRSNMAHFKCPTSVEVRESLPRTATGKLQKFKLRQPYWEGKDKQVG